MDRIEYSIGKRPLGKYNIEINVKNSEKKNKILKEIINLIVEDTLGHELNIHLTLWDPEEFAKKFKLEEASKIDLVGKIKWGNLSDKDMEEMMFKGQGFSVSPERKPNVFEENDDIEHMTYNESDIITGNTRNPDKLIEIIKSVAHANEIEIEKKEQE